jgi:hypothetical protein
MEVMRWSENLKRIDDSKDLGVDEKQYQNQTYENRVGRCGLDASGSR